MSIRSLIVTLPYLAVAAVAGLVGFSITRVDAGAAEHPVSFTASGVLIAAVAIALSRLFSGSARVPTVPERKLLGLKIGVAGFCIAVSGWLVAVFFSHSAGFIVVACGIAVGFVGMAVHIVRMFSRNG